MPVSGKTTDAAPVGNFHPLQEFKGEIVDINEKQEVSRGNKAYTNIVFDIAGLEVIEANEPYAFPTTQIVIAEFNFSNTNWEVFKESLRSTGFTGDLNNLIGKRAHWKWSPARISNRDQTTDKYVVTDSFCWKIIGIDGVSNTSGQLMYEVASIADGNTESEFKAKFLANNEVRRLTGYADVLNMVMQNQLLPNLVLAGTLKVDGDKYVRV
jgi:hypothetical protein